MKKLLTLLFIGILACCVLCGCRDLSGTTPSENENDNPPSTLPEEPTDNNQPNIQEKPEQEEITKIYLTINENKIEVTLAENSSVNALVEILKQGNITYTANDYGGFEKVGSLGHTLPTNNSQITTQEGDVILYSGNQIVLFYGSNSWSYTRLGRINGYSVTQLKNLLNAGKGSIQVTISLE